MNHYRIIPNISNYDPSDDDEKVVFVKTTLPSNEVEEIFELIQYHNINNWTIKDTSFNVSYNYTTLEIHLKNWLLYNVERVITKI